MTVGFETAGSVFIPALRILICFIRIFKNPVSG